MTGALDSSFREWRSIGTDNSRRLCRLIEASVEESRLPDDRTRHRWRIASDNNRPDHGLIACRCNREQLECMAAAVNLRLR